VRAEAEVRPRVFAKRIEQGFEIPIGFLGLVVAFCIGALVNLAVQGCVAFDATLAHPIAKLREELGNEVFGPHRTFRNRPDWISPFLVACHLHLLCFRVLGGEPWITPVRRGVNEERGLLTLKSEHQEAGLGDAEMGD
jgi:hypothetical protein